MPYRARRGTDGLVFHVLNRGVRRSRLFDHAGDYRDCLRVMARARERVNLRLLAYCLMPNHFHLVAWPDADGQLSRFMHWFTGTHSKRWHAARGSTGTGSVYQGRFKAFPIQADGHFLTVCRYVEQNALRAGLVGRAEEWPWSSLAQRCRNRHDVPLDVWPILPPDDWIDLVNVRKHGAETEAVRRASQRCTPYGDGEWLERTSRTLGMMPHGRPVGRPAKWTSGVVLRKS